jgi:hypothetical protein
MTKRFKAIIRETLKRWQETTTSTAQPNVEQAKKLFRAVDKEAEVFVAETPLQFYIGQAIIRGRTSKKNARLICEKYGVDPNCVEHFRYVGGLRDMLFGRTWNRQGINNITQQLIDAFIQEYEPNSKHRHRASPTWRGRGGPGTQNTIPHFCAPDRLYRMFINSGDTVETKDGKKLLVDCLLNFGAGAGTRNTERSMLSILDATSDIIWDLDEDSFNSDNHRFDAVYAEIICKIMNCKNPAIAAYFELFHNTPAFMQFKGAFLILGAKPTIHINADGNIHSDTGPAVAWPDGTGVWMFDGHNLPQFGKKIIMAPSTLTFDEISEINNEEERRIAIERLGWGNYIEAGGGKMLHKRENWVDNTFEVLVSTPENKKTPWRREPLRMVLACRSTGRKYFIAVPNFNREEVASGDGELVIRTCEQAQNWLANGSVIQHLPFAALPLNIIGAS